MGAYWVMVRLFTCPRVTNIICSCVVINLMYIDVVNIQDQNGNLSVIIYL